MSSTRSSDSPRVLPASHDHLERVVLLEAPLVRLDSARRATLRHPETAQEALGTEGVGTGIEGERRGIVFATDEAAQEVVESLEGGVGEVGGHVWRRHASCGGWGVFGAVRGRRRGEEEDTKRTKSSRSFCLLPSPRIATTAPPTA